MLCYLPLPIVYGVTLAPDPSGVGVGGVADHGEDTPVGPDVSNGLSGPLGGPRNGDPGSGRV